MTEIVVGAMGKVAGVREIEEEYSPYPLTFLATILNITKEPAVKPVTVSDNVVIPVLILFQEVVYY